LTTGRLAKSLRAASAIPLAVAAWTGIAGCAGDRRTWKRDAFRPGSTLAVVSVCYDPRLLAMPDSDELPYREPDANVVRGSAEPIVGATKDRLLEALASAELFTVAPEKAVLPALGPELERTPSPGCTRAPGYPAPAVPNDAPALARRLGADAVLNLGMYFGARMTGVSFAGDAVGAAHAEVVLSVEATDRDGRVVWRDVVKGSAEAASFARWKKLDGAQLLEPLQDAAGKAAGRLVARLRDPGQR
jgi:hypothetical protein